jgi:fatty-acid desaturase
MVLRRFDGCDYSFRMFGVTSGYHRYSSVIDHSNLDEIWQFLLAVLAQTSFQKGVIAGGAAHHRFHHGIPIRSKDLHAPAGMVCSGPHWMAVCQETSGTATATRVVDLEKYPN